ncbi:Integrator complex subunit 3 [Actinomortierella ambigua]|nr:Integrator complex subunit 3 [Actinomortierella ambigua]
MAASLDNTGGSLLFDLSPIEEEDSVDVEWKQAFAKLQEAFVDKSEVDIQNWLQINVSRDTATYNETINGLLYTILVATSTSLPSNHANNSHDNPGTTAFRRIGLVTRDGLTFIVRQLRYFCHLPTFYKIRTPVREQIIWLVGQLAEARVQGAEVLFTSLLRQIRGGDISPPNIQLADSVLRLLEEQIQFVYSFPHLIAHSCYTYLRLMLDHGHARFTGLRQREATYCGRLLRERFRECCEVGRDLIRAMQDVARIKEIEDIWADLLHSPERLNPQLESIQQIMATPSNPFYLTGRLTPDMEQRLLHILKHLNHGQHYWNLNKFIERFLSAPETDALYCDVIRYICGVYHPSNQVLASSIVPRFVLINDLFRSVKSNIAAANIKLALFYDWLFYDPARDNIMNIEPAALLLHDSVVPSRAIHHRQPHMTAILVEFLQFTVDNYHPPMREYLQQHVGMAGLDIVDKGVIKSFGDVFKALSHEHYAPVREHLVSLFLPTMGNVGEGILAQTSGGAQGPTTAGGIEADSLDTTDDFEGPTSYLDTPPDGTKDDEDEVLSGGSVGRAPSETPPPGMDVDDSLKQPSETDEEMEEEEEDEVMESSAGPASSASSISAKPALDVASSSLLSDWTAGPSSSISAAATTTTVSQAEEDKSRSRQSSFAGPSASLWLFGSLPQDFKAAFEEDPASEKSTDMFHRIWEVFGDEAGAGVDGTELAKEIGREVRAFAAQASIPEGFCSVKAPRRLSPLSYSQPRGKNSAGGAGGASADDILEQQESRDLGPLEGLISCLWKITRREGPSGALRVARLFLQADSQEAHADRQLSMWFLIGILHGYQRSLESGLESVGDSDVTLAGVLDVYRTLLEEEAAAAVEQAWQAKSETDMDLDTTASSKPSINTQDLQQQQQGWMQSSLLRDLSLLHNRQLCVFDRVLPLVLEHLGDMVPRTLEFFKLVLSLNVPSQLYSLSLGLVRKRFTLFAKGALPPKERQSQGRKNSLANGHTGSTSLRSSVGPVHSTAAATAATATAVSPELFWAPQALVESLKETLDWETYEQVGLWQLFVSEFGGQPVVAARLFNTSWVSRLTFVEQAEALGGVLNFYHSLSAMAPTLQLQLALLRVIGQQQQQQIREDSKDDSVSQDVLDLCASAVEQWGRKHPEALQAGLLHLCRGELVLYAAFEEEQALSGSAGQNSVATGGAGGGGGKKGKRSSQSLRLSMLHDDDTSSSDEFELLKVALGLILVWWKSITGQGNSRPSSGGSGTLFSRDREAEEALFFDFWDSQVRLAVSSRLKEKGHGTMELDQWPSAWWEVRRSASSSSSAAKKKTAATKKRSAKLLNASSDSEDDDHPKGDTKRSRVTATNNGSEEGEEEDEEADEKEEDEQGGNNSGDARDDEEDEEDEDEEEEEGGATDNRTSKRLTAAASSTKKADASKKKVAERASTSATSSPRPRSSPRNQGTRTMESPKTGSTGASQTKGRSSVNSKAASSSPPSRSGSAKASATTTAATTRASRSRNSTVSSRSTRSRRRDPSEVESEEEDEKDGDDDEEEQEDHSMEEDEKETAASGGEDSAASEEDEDDDDEEQGDDHDEQEKSDDDDGDEEEEEEEEDGSEEENPKPTKGKGSAAASSSRNAKAKTAPQRRRLTKATSSKSAKSQAAARKPKKRRGSGRSKNDDESDYQESASEESEEEEEEDGEAEEEGEAMEEDEEQQSGSEDEGNGPAASKKNNQSKAKKAARGGAKKKSRHDSDAMDEDDPEENSAEEAQSHEEDEDEDEAEDEAKGGSDGEKEGDDDEEENEEEEEEEEDDSPRSRARATRASGAGSRSTTQAQRRGSAASRRAMRTISSSPEAQPAKRRGKHKRRITDDEDDESS